MNDAGDAHAVRLALPWLQESLHFACEAGQELQLPALEWLVGRASSRRQVATGWREWLLAGSGLGERALERFAAGPCVAAACGESRIEGVWAVAQPVHLATAIDHLRLTPLEEVALTPAEAAALIATVNNHLAGTEFKLAYFAPGCWALQCRGQIECTAREPAEVVGRNVWDFMPAGRDGPAVRSLMNEIQMLLHEHPINDERVLCGRLPVNSLWLWGFGAVARPSTQLLPGLCTDDPWLAGLWRLNGGCSMATEDACRAFEPEFAITRLALVNRASGGAAAALLAADSGVLAAARSALASGRCAALQVLTGDTVFELDGRARWRFWRRPADLASVFG